MNNTPLIVNRSAYYDYFIEEKEVAGVILVGSEIRPLRDGKASIGEAYILIDEDGKNAYIKNMYIKNLNQNAYSHEEQRVRKILLTKHQLEKWKKKTQSGGLTIIPLKAYFDPKGKFKIELGLAKGKKNWDKKNVIKEKDIKKETDRELKK